MNTVSNSAEFSLQFEEVYRSSEWQLLDPLERVGLILVAEDIKPAAAVIGDRNFVPFFEKMNVESRVLSDEHELDQWYEISRPGLLSAHTRKLLFDTTNYKEDTEKYDHYRRTGELFGYPSCCIERFVQRAKDQDEGRSSCNPKYFSHLEEHLAQLFSYNEEYPSALNACMNGFIPCKADCNDATKMMTKWLEVLQIADPQAAATLRLWNISKHPEEELFSYELDVYENSINMEWNRWLFRRTMLGVVEDKPRVYTPSRPDHCEFLDLQPAHGIGFQGFREILERSLVTANCIGLIAECESEMEEESV